MPLPRLSRRSFVVNSLAFGFVASSAPAYAANVASVLRGDALKWNGTVIDLDPLKSYYRGKFGNGIWTGKKGLSKRGVELVRALQDARSDGLEPRDYLSALPKNIQKLFPNSFVFDDEIGWVPEGWKTAVFGDIGKHVRENVPADKLIEYEFYVGLEHIGRQELFLSDGESTESITSNKSAFLKHDLLFGKLRPYFHKVCIAPGTGVCSTDILVFRAQNESWASFMYLTAYTDKFVEYANMRSTGTRMPRASVKDMLKYEIAIPSQAILESFEAQLSPIWEKGMEAVLASSSLAKLRDTLLPQLLSGELRIPDAEKLVANSL